MSGFDSLKEAAKEKARQKGHNILNKLFGSDEVCKLPSAATFGLGIILTTYYHNNRSQKYHLNLSRHRSLPRTMEPIVLPMEITI